MNELVPFVRLKDIETTGLDWIHALLSSRVCQFYVLFSQYGAERPSVGLLVNFQEPLLFPGIAESHGCEICLNTGRDRDLDPDPSTDVALAPFAGDLTSLRAARVAFQFDFTEAYKGPNSLRVGDLYNILRGSYHSLPMGHHTNLTRFELVKHGLQNHLWNERGRRDLVTQWMVRLHQCGFIGWETIGQGISNVKFVSFHIVRTNNFDDIIGHIYTDSGVPPNTVADTRKCKVTARPIVRGRFLEDSVLRIEHFDNVILPYAQASSSHE
ncbi:hypothetical protein BKA56DRAFT_725929 [Ilyonectria sp. MPI-CAGE-AT-0026]|nr:hypothetical protein BKA56DRAFT_725929 [Ilyonectria sp. MPI-CAGE-AT-0026]